MAPFAEVLPDRIEVTILTDRGFADAKLFGFLDDLGSGATHETGWRDLAD
jgi:hypothetical protein